MAIHNLYKLVFTARLYMKKASKGCFVFVTDYSGEPAAHPGFAGSGGPAGSRTEFEVGRTISCDEGANIPMIPPMDTLSNVHQNWNCFTRDPSRLTFLLSSGPAEVVLVEAVPRLLSTEAETRRRTR